MSSFFYPVRTAAAFSETNVSDIGCDNFAVEQAAPFCSSATACFVREHARTAAVAAMSDEKV